LFSSYKKVKGNKHTEYASHSNTAERNAEDEYLVPNRNQVPIANVLVHFGKLRYEEYLLACLEGGKNYFSCCIEWIFPIKT